MKFITSLFGGGSPKTMGKRYMKVGRNALLGIKPDQKNGVCSERVPTPLSMLISRGGKLKHKSKYNVNITPKYCELQEIMIELTQAYFNDSLSGK